MERERNERRQGDARNGAEVHDVWSGEPNSKILTKILPLL